MIDIDHFKAVNDGYGHAVGDIVIKDVVKAIQRNVRDVDTAARWGGEEFIVLAPMTPKNEAMIPARRILASVSEHIFAGIGDKKITVSIGISDISRPGIDMPDNLIQAADVAMYEAKERGRNRIEVEP